MLPGMQGDERPTQTPAPGLSLKALLFAGSDLLFNLDSKLWRTLIGLVRHPLETNRVYLEHGGGDLLNPIKLLAGLCTLSVVVWAILPILPGFAETLERVAPEVVEQIRESLAEDSVAWAHFSEALDQRMNLLNVPFMLLVALPLIGYLKLLRRDRALVGHAVFTLNYLNIYLVFNLISTPLYLLDWSLIVISAIPLVGIMLPYMLAGLWCFYLQGPFRYTAGAIGLVAVFLIGYVIASNVAVLVGMSWTTYAVLG